MLPTSLYEAARLYYARAWVREEILSLTCCAGTWRIVTRYKVARNTWDLAIETVNPSLLR